MLQLQSQSRLPREPRGHRD